MPQSVRKAVWSWSIWHNDKFSNKYANKWRDLHAKHKICIQKNTSVCCKTVVILFCTLNNKEVLMLFLFYEVFCVCAAIGWSIVFKPLQLTTFGFNNGICYYQSHPQTFELMSISPASVRQQLLIKLLVPVMGVEGSEKPVTHKDRFFKRLKLIAGDQFVYHEAQCQGPSLNEQNTADQRGSHPQTVRNWPNTGLNCIIRNNKSYKHE